MRILPAGRALFAVLALCGAVSAQTMGTGTINGTVTDASGGVMAGVKVTANHVETGIERSVVTGSGGSYVLPALPVGTYTLRAVSPGFKAFTREGIRLDVDTTVTVNMTLAVGPSTQSVTVTGAPPPIPTSSGEMSTLATGAQVSELSFNGRNFTQILTLGTGVASQQVGRRMGVGQEGNSLMSVNGGRINSTKFTYDGILAMDTGGNRGLNLFPPMDATSEVQIKTSNYTADSGSFGYGLVNVVTKSGGSEFHGDLYEVLGNDAVDARNFFDNRVAPLKQNIFGFTFGGPIYIPHRYNKDRNKTFFFVSEGWNRRRGPQLVNFTAPPQSTFTAQTIEASYRQGNFSGLSGPIKDPTTGQPFQGNIIPPDRIDPNATALMDRFYPLPDRSAAPNFVATPDSAANWREDLARVDQQLTGKMLLTFRYAHDSWSEDQAILAPSNFSFPTGPGSYAKPGYNVIGRLTWTISPATINVFTDGFSRNAITELPNLSAVSRTGLNIPEVLPGNLYGAIPLINVSGYGNIGVGGLTNNVNNIFEWKDDLTHVTGPHTFKAGIDFLRLQKFDFGNGNTEGTFTFNGQATGNPVADFLLGRAFNYTESSVAPNGYFFSSVYEMYAQDDWKVASNLTLNLGLRWSIFAGAPIGYDKYDKLSGFNPALYAPADAPVLLTDGEIRPGSGDPLNGIFTPTDKKSLGLPRSLLQTRYIMPGPRFGFAWSPGGDGRMAFRGGYGVFYHWDNDNQENLRTNPPFTSSVNIQNTLLSNPAGGTNRVFPKDLQAFDPQCLYPMVQQWSLSVERELPGQVVLSTAYVGNHAVHLDQTININQPQPNLAIARGTLNVNTVRPYLGYGNISYDTRSASASYNALQVSAARRMTKGVLFQASYTYSKSIAFGVGQNQPLQPDEKGLSSLDQTHNLTLNFVWDLPFFRNEHGVAAKAFGGWEWSGIATFASGFPFTVTQPGDRAGVGGGTQRPNVAGTPTRFGWVGEFFDVTAFALAPQGQFGNEGSNALRGPGIGDDFTMNFYRNVAFRMWGREGQNLRIGAELFNIFNHANFSAVGNVFGTPTFGRITAALDPREIQFSARLSF